MTDHKPIPWLVPDKRFVQLQVPKKTPQAVRQGYRVYSGKEEFVEVEAATIGEAIEKSGVKEPLKLERMGIASITIYREGELEHLSGYGGTDRMQKAMEQAAVQQKIAGEANAGESAGEKPAAEA